jgi:methionyl-tRNA formyltransferase
VHELVDALDAGPILGQRRFTIPDGTSETDLELTAARFGGDLLARVIVDLVAGCAERNRQDESNASYDPWPEPKNYVIDTHREARAAFNFIRGVRERGQQIIIASGDSQIAVFDAVRFARARDTLCDGTNEDWVRFDSGYLLVRLAGQ